MAVLWREDGGEDGGKAWCGYTRLVRCRRVP